jgi:hypothetical protein
MSSKRKPPAALASGGFEAGEARSARLHHAGLFGQLNSERSSERNKKRTLFGARHGPAGRFELTHPSPPGMIP